MNDPREVEKEMLSEHLPPINALGPAATERARLFRDATLSQLLHAKEELDHYVGQFTVDDMPDLEAGKMPHEWGSLDTYDDCRNSLGLASAMLEQILDAPEDEKDQVRLIRELFNEYGSPCAVAKGVEKHLTQEQLLIEKGDPEYDPTRD